MFVDFFYILRDSGIPVTPTAFLRLHRALQMGLILTLNDFYTAARAILIKTERHFDIYDRVFAHYFQGADLELPQGVELSELVRNMLAEWLQKPEELARVLGVDSDTLSRMSPEELVQYFLDRLKEQKEEHHGGNKWIGTRGTSPVGHSGFHPGGMRVGGISGAKSALKVAMDRRYREYSDDVPLTRVNLGEALRRLRHLQPVGPRDVVNIEESIRQTMKNGGDIEIVYDRRMLDRLKIVLAIDNGGWSMEPYVEMVQVLFNHVRSQFKDLKIFFFHNTIYDYLWEDPPRIYKPFKVDELVRLDSDTRFIIVGDASMAPYELLASDGSIHVEDKMLLPSIERLKFIARTFSYAVWINPKMKREWDYTRTIAMIREIFPMFELSISGLEQAVNCLRAGRAV